MRLYLTLSKADEQLKLFNLPRNEDPDLIGQKRTVRRGKKTFQQTFYVSKRPASGVSPTVLERKPHALAQHLFDMFGVEPQQNKAALIEEGRLSDPDSTLYDLPENKKDLEQQIKNIEDFKREQSVTYPNPVDKTEMSYRGYTISFLHQNLGKYILSTFFVKQGDKRLGSESRGSPEKAKQAALKFVDNLIAKPVQPQNVRLEDVLTKRDNSRALFKVSDEVSVKRRGLAEDFDRGRVTRVEVEEGAEPRYAVRLLDGNVRWAKESELARTSPETKPVLSRYWFYSPDAKQERVKPTVSRKGAKSNMGSGMLSVSIAQKVRPWMEYQHGSWRVFNPYAGHDGDAFVFNGQLDDLDARYSYFENDLAAAKTFFEGLYDRYKHLAAAVHPEYVGKPESTEIVAKAAYKLERRLKWHGLDISIEHDKGSTRSGADKDGKPWSITMQYPYGYIRRTIGADNQKLDCYVGDNEKSKMVYVVHQVEPATGKFDEEKIMISFPSADQAKRAYLAHYNSPKFFGGMTQMPVDQFVQLVNDGKIHGRMLIGEPRARARKRELTRILHMIRDARANTVRL